MKKLKLGVEQIAEMNEALREGHRYWLIDTPNGHVQVRISIPRNATVREATLRGPKDLWPFGVPDRIWLKVITPKTKDNK